MQTGVGKMDTSQTEGKSLTLLLPIRKDQKPFKCGLCSFSFDIILELDTHISEHSLTKPFQCGYCQVSYDTSSELTVHIDTHQLFICLAKGSPTQLGDYLPGENVAQVKSTAGDLKVKGDYSENTREDSDADPVVSGSFSDEDTSLSTRGDPDVPKPQSKGNVQTKKVESDSFSCPLCGQNFKLQADLKKHSITDHGDDRPFHCSRCPSRFKQNTHLVDHLNSVHRSHKPFTCPFCGDRFKIKSYLRHHMSRKHQVDAFTSNSVHSKSRLGRDSSGDATEEKGSVPKRKVVFISDSHMSYENTKFSIADRETTELVSEDKTTSQGVKDSVDSEEDEALPHSFLTTSLGAGDTQQAAPVPQPSASWDTAQHQQGMKEEMDTETSNSAELGTVRIKSEKPDSISPLDPADTTEVCPQDVVKFFKCGMCGSTFSSSTDVDVHWQTTHGTCGLCGDWFSDPVSMNTHKKSVHREVNNMDRPFICGICGKGFRVARYVWEHARKLHKKTHLLKNYSISRHSGTHSKETN